MANRGLTFMAIAALVGSQLGCASHVAPPPRPSISVRAQIGAVGVVAAEFAPQTDFSRPVPGKPLAAMVGMTSGFGVGLGSAVICFGTYGQAALFCGLAIWTPVMMGAGVVEGMDKGVTVTDWIESSRMLGRAAAESEAQETLRDAVVVAAAERRSARPVVSLLEGGPRDVKASPSYRPLGAEGLDTVLEVAVVGLELRRANAPGAPTSYGPAPSWEKVFDPSLELIVEARARLVRAADDALLFTRPYRHSGPRRTFVEWARDGAVPFREARDAALRALGAEIAEDFFGPPPAPPAEPAPPPGLPPDLG